MVNPYAIALTHWAWYARIVRSIMLSLKNKEYVLVSKMCGALGVESFKKNMLRPILAQCVIVATLDIGHVMLHIAGLSFLGLGVKSPTSEWGIMISDAKDFIFTYPELIYYPGVALFLYVMSFNIIGDYLRDKLDGARWWKMPKLNINIRISKEGSEFLRADFSLEPAKITAMLGKSGSGKSLSATSIFGFIAYGFEGGAQVNLGNRPYNPRALSMIMQNSRTALTRS